MVAPSEGLAANPIQPGEQLARRYRVERIIGAGGMGVVVAATHLQLGRAVAIKLLTVGTDLHPDAVDRFLREARAAACLRSEHIARVMDAGIDDRGRHFIVMEYLEGEDLAEVVRRRAPALSVTDAVGYLLQACEGIAEAHTQGIIHRDLKPENLFLTQRVDGSPLVKILDFGISKMTDNNRGIDPLTANEGKALFGSPLYMSPEQIRTPASIDPRSDVWALGVIMFELLTGISPFSRPSLRDILASILTDPHPDLAILRPDLPPPLVAVVHGCLAKNPDDRTASVGALAEGLHPWAPRWARDSSTRAAYMAGIAIEGGSPETVDGPIPEEEKQIDNMIGEASAVEEITRHGFALPVALGIGGVACALLTMFAIVTNTRASVSVPAVSTVSSMGACVTSAGSVPATMTAAIVAPRVNRGPAASTDGAQRSDAAEFINQASARIDVVTTPMSFRPRSRAVQARSARSPQGPKPGPGTAVVRYAPPPAKPPRGRDPAGNAIGSVVDPLEGRK